ncbi:MAG: hypothetical protein IT207_04415 [Fimbriimonadaceae bacterium]|nr:hypothetical protein [Fimbriimonadaceae bacterium]
MASEGRTYTFLFTDLAQSSAGWEHDRLAMGERISRHNAEVRRAVEASGGTVFKSLGDGLAAVFDLPHDAVFAAVECVRTLQDAEVRIGVHSGYAEPMEGDFQGAAVNRVARIVELARPGQVLVSSTCHDLAVDLLSPNIEWKKLGQVVLRGHTRREVLWQAFRNGEGSEVAPFASLGTQSDLVPVDHRFVGRDHERAALRAFVLEGISPIVTVLGFGGVGKSSLANAVAWDCLHRFPGGVRWLDCESCRTGEQALAAIAIGLDQPVDNLTPEAIAAAAAETETLLILDCCEGIAAELGFLSRIVRSCARLRVLITSRRLIGLPGEQTFELKGLDQTSSRGVPSPAERLFLEAANLAVPDFAPTKSQLRTVTGIVRALEGIPLAIILAASRLRHVSLEDVEARVRNSQLGALRSPSGQGRHSSLHQVVESTVSLLDPEDRAAAARFTVFQGGFRLEDALGVLGDTDETLDLLSRLRDSSLLATEIRHQALRYRQLDSVREFLLESTPANELAPWRDAHARHFAQLALATGKAMLAAASVTVAEAIQADGGNFKAGFAHAVESGNRGLVLDYARGLARIYVESGLLHEFGFLAVESTAAAVAEGDHGLYIELLGLQGIAARRSGFPEVAAGHWEERANAAHQIGDASAEADALGDLIDLSIEQGDPDAARQLVERLRHVVPQSTDPEAGVWLELFEARCLVIEGHPSDGLAMAIAAQSRQSDPAHTPYVLSTVAKIAREAGDYGASLRAANRMVRHALEGRQLHRAGVGLIEVATTAEESGDRDLARRAVAAMLALPRRHSPRVVAFAREAANRLGVQPVHCARAETFLSLVTEIVSA